jgi:hypothetical protein
MRRIIVIFVILPPFVDNVNKLDVPITQLKGSFEFIRKELVIAAMIFSPWEVEEWAKELLVIDPSSEVAGTRTLKYLGGLYRPRMASL